jgi:N6-adenosine-specific RNA methylase IME4
MDRRPFRLIAGNTLLPAIPKPGEFISAETVLRIEAEVIAALPFVESIEEADDWRRRAKAIEAYLRSPELQRPMLGAQRRIEARIGQLLGPAIIGGDRQSDQSHHDETASHIPHSEDRAAFRLLARALAGACELTADGWRKSRRSLVSLVRHRLGLLPEAPPLPEGRFSCIVADPPWQVTTGPDVFHGTCERAGLPLDYETMSVEEICTLKDASGRAVQDCFADDAHLYLWTVNRYVEQSYSVARAWGFKPSELLTWFKGQRGVGLGNTYRHTTEFVLFCRRGSLPHLQIIPTTLFQWPRGRHSQKPDEFYAMVEGVTPGRRLDLFAREQREGWQCWGDAVGD